MEEIDETIDLSKKKEMFSWLEKNLLDSNTSATVHIDTKRISVYEPKLYDLLLKFGNEFKFEKIVKDWIIE